MKYFGLKKEIGHRYVSGVKCDGSFCLTQDVAEALRFQSIADLVTWLRHIRRPALSDRAVHYNIVRIERQPTYVYVDAGVIAHA